MNSVFKVLSVVAMLSFVSCGPNVNKKSLGECIQGDTEACKEVQPVAPVVRSVEAELTVGKVIVFSETEEFDVIENGETIVTERFTNRINVVASGKVYQQWTRIQLVFNGSDMTKKVDLVIIDPATEQITGTVVSVATVQFTVEHGTEHEWLITNGNGETYSFEVM